MCNEHHSYSLVEIDIDNGKETVLSMFMEEYGVPSHLRFITLTILMTKLR